MSESSWYALTVKPRHEKTTAWNLRLKGLDEFLPLYRARRRWCDRMKELDLLLFPGYVFSRFSYEHRMAVLKTPGVTSIVGFGKTPAAIPEAEILAIQRIVTSRLPVVPCPYMGIGEAVRVEQGCLQGVEGKLLREKDSWRVVINVELLQRSVAVEIAREMIRPLRAPAWPLFGSPVSSRSVENPLCPS
jgi:transcription antitermination factor NusG